MTDQPAAERRNKAGGIRQYATLGKSKTSESSNASTSEGRSVETLEDRDAQTLERSDSRDTGLPEVEASKRQSAQKPELSGVGMLKRERHTIYLPLELSEWVKIRAVKTKREISEVVTEAIERYRSEIE